jgi:hypothetical protein
MLRIHRTPFEARDVWLLGAQSGRRLLLTESLTLALGREFAHYAASLQGRLNELRKPRVHCSSSCDEGVEIV